MARWSPFGLACALAPKLPRAAAGGVVAAALVMHPGLVSANTNAGPSASAARSVIDLALVPTLPSGLFHQLAVYIGVREPDVLGDRGLDAAIAAARKMSDAGQGPVAATSRGTVVALDVGPEGHYTFALANGDRYTAGTAKELERAGSVIVPQAASGLADSHLVLSTRSLFAGAEALRRLPIARQLSVVVAGQAYPLERRANGTLAFAIAPVLWLTVEDPDQLREAILQLQRPVPQGRVDVISVREPADLKAVSPGKADAARGMFGPLRGLTFGIEGASRKPVAVPADAERLAEAIGSLPRRMLLFTGLSGGGDQVTFELPSGRVARTPVADLLAAAQASDADLVLFETDPPRQPGGRTLLYQTVSLANAERAVSARTFQDLLVPVAEARGGFNLRFSTAAQGIVRFSAVAKSGGGLMAGAADMADAVVGEVMGALRPRAITGFLVPDGRRRELAARLVPWLPSAVQWAYVALVLVGLLGWRTARRWWRRIWPIERRRDYAGRAGYIFARGARFIAFVGLFLPIAGFAASISGLLARRRGSPDAKAAG